MCEERTGREGVWKGQLGHMKKKDSWEKGGREWKRTGGKEVIPLIFHSVVAPRAVTQLTLCIETRDRCIQG